MWVLLISISVLLGHLPTPPNNPKPGQKSRLKHRNEFSKKRFDFCLALPPCHPLPQTRTKTHWHTSRDLQEFFFKFISVLHWHLSAPTHPKPGRKPTLDSLCLWCEWQNPLWAISNARGDEIVDQGVKLTHGGGGFTLPNIHEIYILASSWPSNGKMCEVKLSRVTGCRSGSHLTPAQACVQTKINLWMFSQWCAPKQEQGGSVSSRFSLPQSTAKGGAIPQSNKHCHAVSVNNENSRKNTETRFENQQQR